MFTKVLSNRTSARVRRNSVIDGQERLISARSLSALPSRVVATTTVADALANWRNWAITIVGVALMIGLLISGVVVSAHGELEEISASKTLQRNTALNNMSQGLCMFDAAQRLIVCNKRYADLYGFD